MSLGTQRAPSRRFDGAIVIPSLAEAANLPHTLESLSRNPADLLDRFAILIVVNQRADASEAETTDNHATLETPAALASSSSAWTICSG